MSKQRELNEAHLKWIILEWGIPNIKEFLYGFIFDDEFRVSLDDPRAPLILHFSEFWDEDTEDTKGEVTKFLSYILFFDQLN